MRESYFAAILRFAFQRSILLTDRLSIIAGVLLPAITLVSGRPMPVWVAGYVAWFIIIAVGGGVLLRLITAPYFLWREQNDKIDTFQNDLSKPEQIEREALAHHFAATRARLAGELAELAALAERYEPRKDNRGRYVNLPVNESFNLMHQFADDNELVGLCRDYIQSCLIIVNKKENYEDAREETRELDKIARKLLPMLRRTG